MNTVFKAAVTGLALAASMMFGAAANAATYTNTHDLTSSNPTGVVKGQNSIETFDFSDIGPGIIHSLLITLTYSLTGDSINSKHNLTESWTGMILGGNGSVPELAFNLISDGRQPGTDIYVTSDSGFLTSGAAFNAAVADQFLTVLFHDSINPKSPKPELDKFKLSQIVLTVDYTPIPVPASGLLLLGGLGGLAALRRRKSV